jgi:hypothetical protein
MVTDEDVLRQRNSSRFEGAVSRCSGRRNTAWIAVEYAVVDHYQIGLPS